ncbi:MAG: hypothetical protein QXJ19_03960 [Candidatus Bathyarchaeia archaeon]|nr:hypothetical protein [Candidatus Bathyarchaeota archaeon]
MSEVRKCSPKCNKFKCGKNFLVFRGKNPWCRFTEEPCNPINCNYAMCINRRLLSHGICGETVKRRTVERGPEEEEIPVVRVRGKVLRKIGEKEVF